MLVVPKYLKKHPPQVNICMYAGRVTTPSMYRLSAMLALKLDIVSNWPGSRHDAFIWANCGLGHQLDIQRLDFILGDSGYPLKPNLLDHNMILPVLNPASHTEQRYNTSHRKTRCCIEKCIGILKSVVCISQGEPCNFHLHFVLKLL